MGAYDPLIAPTDTTILAVEVGTLLCPTARGRLSGEYPQGVLL